MLVGVFFLQKRLTWQLGGAVFNEWLSAYFYATDILIVALIFLWFWREKKEIKWKNFLTVEFFKKIEGALLVFLVIAGLSVVISQNKVLGFYNFIKLLEFALLFLYIKNNFVKLFSWQKLWQFFIAGAAAQSVIALIQFFTQKSLGWKIFAESPLSPDMDGVAKIIVGGVKMIRAYGLVPHPNILAAILVAAIFGLTWLFLEKYERLSTVKRIFFGAVFVSLSIALFFTFSRAVIVIGLALSILWLIWFYRSKEYKKAAMIALAALFAVYCSLLFIFWPYFSARFTLQNLDSSQSLNLRMFYNETAFNLIKQNPLLGIGLGNFVAVFGQYYNNLQPWIFQPAHNIYLLAAAETGIAGLLAFLWFLFLTVKSAWRKRKDLITGCLLLVVSCFLFFGLFDHFLWDIQQGQIMFWLFLGLLASLSPCSSAD